MRWLGAEILSEIMLCCYVVATEDFDGRSVGRRVRGGKIVAATEAPRNDRVRGMHPLAEQATGLICALHMLRNGGHGVRRTNS